MVAIPSGLGFAKLSAEIRVQPMLAFYQHSVALGMQFEDTFQHWRTDGLSIRFLDAKSRSAAVIAHNRLAFEVDLPGDYQNFISKFRPLALGYLKLPSIKKVLRWGIRGHYFITRGFAFEELVTLFEESFFLPAARRQTFLPGKTNDLMFNMVLEREQHLLVHVIAEPVRKAELERWTKPITYDLGDPPEPIEYPDVAAFLDIDVYSDTIAASNDVFDILASGAKTIVETASALTAYLFPKR